MHALAPVRLLFPFPSGLSSPLSRARLCPRQKKHYEMDSPPPHTQLLHSPSFPHLSPTGFFCCHASRLKSRARARARARRRAATYSSSTHTIQKNARVCRTAARVAEAFWRRQGWFSLPSLVPRPNTRARAAPHDPSPVVSSHIDSMSSPSLIYDAHGFLFISVCYFILVVDVCRRRRMDCGVGGERGDFKRGLTIARRVMNACCCDALNDN
jgi:hypothetical protein